MSESSWKRPTVVTAVLVALVVIVVAVISLSALRSTTSLASAPRGVHAVAHDASATLHWSPPSTNGGATIDSYTVTSRPDARSCTTVTTSCTVKGLTNGTPYTFTVVARNAAGTSPPSSASHTVTPAATLSACWSLSTSATAALSPAVRAVVTRYYVAKHLEPVTFFKNQQWTLHVAQQSKGVHYCTNPDGSKSGYVGSVPPNATAAVMVEVTHKPYPVVEAPTNFVTVARLATGWKVVGEGTGP